MFDARDWRSVVRIVIDARTLGSRPSGIGMYLNDFLKQLKQYKEFEFTLLTDVAESEYIKHFANQGIKVIAWGKHVYKSAGVYAYFAFVKKTLKELNPDLFWEVNALIPVNLKGNFKVMVTIHDMFPIDYEEYCGKIYSMYFKYNIRKTLNNVDMILYNSAQTKKNTENYFPKAARLPNCNAYIISNPLTDRFEESDNNYFLYVGNMEKRKGVDLLLKAYVRYRENGGKKPLVLAGKMLEEDVKQLIDSTKKRVDGITYMNYVDNATKHKLFAQCSCFVFPSKAEGFGMPVLEVMKFKKPVIVSNLDIFDEIVGDCVNRFDLRGNEETQIDNLAQMLMDYSSRVEADKYEETVNRYAPDILGQRVREFILKEVTV